MSSYYERTRYVDNAEWNRINNVISNTNAYINTVQADISRLQMQMQDLQQQINADHLERVKVGQDAMNALQNGFQSALNATTADFVHQAGTVMTSFNHSMSDLQTHTSQLGQEITNLGSHFNQINDNINSTNIHAAQLGQQLEGLSGEIGQLNRNLQGIGNRVGQVADAFNQAYQGHLAAIDSVGEKAEAILSSLDDLLRRINELKPQVFEPNRFRALTSVRELTASSMASGDYAAALMTSQNSMIEASSLLARLIVENEQFDNALFAARQGASALQGRINSYLATGALVDHQTGESYEYDIDFWSHGGFHTLEEEFNRLNEVLNNPNLDFEQLQDIVRRLANLDGRIDECDRKAREARMAAVVVQGLVTRIFERLGSSSWNLAEWGYDEEDERNAYRLVYDNGAGDSVAMVVAPHNPESPAFMMEAFSEDENRRAVIKDGIDQALEESGVTILDRQVQNDCHLNTDTTTFMERASSQFRASTQTTTSTR